MRRTLKILAALVMLVVVGVVAVIALLPTERIASLAADQVRAATGRELTLTGDLSPSIFPVLGIETGAVALSNADWGAADHLVSAEGASVGVELWPLLSGVVKIKEVRLTTPVVSLERREDGTGNWEFAPAGDAEAPEGSDDAGGADEPGFLANLSLDRAVIENGAVSFDDRAAGRRIELTEINAEAALPAFDEALTVAGDAVWNGRAATAAVTLASPAAALSGAPVTIDARLEAAEALIDFKGTVAPAPEGAATPVAAFDGAFEIAAADPAGALTWATGAPAPDGLAKIGELAVTGQAALDGGGASLTVEGGATRAGERASLNLTAASGPDWASAPDFDVDFSVEIGALAAAGYKGRVAAGEGAAPVTLDGDWRVAADDPAAAAWAVGEAPPALEGLSALDLSGAVKLNAEGLDAAAKGGASRAGETAVIDVAAKGAADWAERLAFDLSIEAAVGALAGFSFDGAVAPAEGAAPVTVDGAYRIAAANPGAAAAWATGGPAPAALHGLGDVDLAGEIDLTPDGVRATAKGGAVKDGERARVDLTMAGGEDWLARRAVRLDASGGVGEMLSLSFAGDVAAPTGGAPTADGRLTLDAPDLRGLAAYVGAELPPARSKAFRSLSFKGDVATTGPGALRVRAEALNFDDIEASGVVTANYGGPLKVTADLDTSVLRLRRYLGGGGGDAPPAGVGWSQERLDLSGIGAVDGDFKLRAAGVLLPNGLRLGKSDIAAKIRNGRLDLNIREVGLYGGGVVGDVAIDGRNGNALKAKISAASVRLLPMLKALADLTSIEGFGRVEMDVAGGGASLHDIMNSLDGTGAISLTDGALVGYNLAAMVRNVKGAFGGGAAGEQKTDFAEIAGAFQIVDGVMRNDDFRFLGPLIRITGGGEIDLGGRSMNFRLTPKAVTSLEGQGGAIDAKGLAFPLLVTGPWDDLSIRPDLEGGLLDVLKDPDGALNAIEGLSKGVDGLKDGAIGGAVDQLKEGGADGLLEKVAPGAGGAAGAILKGVLGGGDKAAPEPAAKTEEAVQPRAKKKRSEMTAEERKAERKRKRKEKRQAERKAKQEAQRKAAEEDAAKTPEGQIKSLIDGILKAD